MQNPHPWIDAVIDSMGWDLDAIEKDDMRHLSAAILAAQPAPAHLVESLEALLRPHNEGGWLTPEELDAARATLNKARERVAQDADDAAIDLVARLIEGKTVSVDVSTGDADIGNRLFATVAGVQTDPSEGFVILAVDPEPNYKTERAAPSPEKADGKHHCPPGACIAGTIGGELVSVSEWPAALLRFEGKIELWSELTKRHAIPHIGYIEPSQFCCNCGDPIARPAAQQEGQA
ncbi:hypothetical protein [Geopseudomonas aromaticivorans]